MKPDPNAASSAAQRPALVTAFIAVGSNLGPAENISAALAALRKRVRVTGVSTFYRTAALRPPPTPPGPGAGAPSAAREPGTPAPPQPPFVNGVLRIETDLPPRALKYDVLRRIEADLGRVRTADKYAPRTLDLDLILYGTLVSTAADLRLPDPAIRMRNFIALPLLELAPELALPDNGDRLSRLPVARQRAGLEAVGGFA